ncbi:MAG TPA: aldolase/citrate lyase family protein [Gaiellaceae bacterium]|nr:aldolase/citrate lyase family protein [Gaiellaceae bacterium]
MSDIQSPTAVDLAHARSLLFTPGDDEAGLRSALASAADAVVGDLEHSVAPERKQAARDLVAELRPPVVRVNGADTAWFEADLALVAELDPAAVVLPAATPETVSALGAAGPPVIAIVETGAGVRLAYETASRPRVAALLLGAVDLGADLGLEPRRDGLELAYARGKLVVDSAAAGVRPPFDVVHLDVHDDAGLEHECRLARSLGFRGKACLAPAQLETVHRVFGTVEEELAARTRRIPAEAKGARG